MQQRPNGRGTPPGFPHLRRLPLPFIEAPPGGPIYQPPRRSSHRFRQDQASQQLNGRKRQSARWGRPTACASIQQRHRTEGRKVGRQEEGAAPQESNGRPGSGIVRNGEAGQGWHRPPAPPERAQDARSRPRPGVGPSDPRKTPLRPVCSPGIRRPGARRPTWPGGRVVFRLYACKM